MKPDVKLQHDVLEELDWDSGIDAAQIGVTAKDGVVTLTGHVPVFAEKLAAEDVTKRVHGVRAVANEIEVRPPASHHRHDEEIAAAAVHALKWAAKVPDERLQVTVRQGWLTLEGTVSEPFEKQTADRTLRQLVGARGVTNTIRIDRRRRAAPPEQPHWAAELKSIIEAALRRSATVNSKQVTVEIEEQRVVLSGDVHSHAELDEAERIAWAAPGVAEVENDITITPWGYGPAEEWGY